MSILSWNCRFTHKSQLWSWRSVNVGSILFFFSTRLFFPSLHFPVALLPPYPIFKRNKMMLPKSMWRRAPNKTSSLNKIIKLNRFQNLNYENKLIKVQWKTFKYFTNLLNSIQKNECQPIMFQVNATRNPYCARNNAHFEIPNVLPTVRRLLLTNI